MKGFHAIVSRRLKYSIWVIALFVLIVLLIGFLYGYESRGSERDFVLGLQTGIFIGTIAMILLKMKKLWAASRDETALKRLYIEEKDERRQLIEQKANSFSLQAILLLTSLAAVVSGFIDVTVSITLFAVLAMVALVGIIAKLYYSRKY